MTSIVRVVLQGADVLMVDGEKKHRAGSFELKKNGDVLFDVEGNDWTFDADELREIADAADRFKTFADSWKPETEPKP